MGLRMINLMHGDCLELMKTIPDKSIDMVLTDLPYGTTECYWDIMLPFDPMWKELKRIVKKESVLSFFGNDLFTARLKLSNPEMYRYSLVWQKSRVARYAQAKHRPLSEHEDIIIFSEGKCSSNSKVLIKYFPQNLIDCNKQCTQGKSSLRENRSDTGKAYVQTKTGYPKSILKFNSDNKPVHPTQKPVALLEYLVKTYTLENETVLDFTMGSGSTGVACKNLNRKFIGIEKDDKYFEIAKSRIETNA